MKLLSLIVTCLILGATGAYVLWQFHSAWGLGGGLLCIFLMLCIAFPTNIRPGVETLRANITVIGPVLVDALKGGQRKTDPPADPPKPKSEA